MIRPSGGAGSSSPSLLPLARSMGSLCSLFVINGATSLAEFKEYLI